MILKSGKFFRFVFGEIWQYENQAIFHPFYKKKTGEISPKREIKN
jgi:hypothetical protein